MSAHFHPVRIIASEGQRFDVHYPDLVMVGERDLIIGRPTQRNAAIYVDAIRLALVHVVALEDLPTSTASTNGDA